MDWAFELAWQRHQDNMKIAEIEEELIQLEERIKEIKEILGYE